MAFFYRTMDTQRQKYPNIPHLSQPATPVETPVQTRTATPNISDDEDDASPVDKASSRGDRNSWAGSTSSAPKKRHQPHQSRHRHHHSLFHLPHHHHVLREALNQSQEHHPVGVFESQQYMNIEKRRHHPQGEILEEKSLRLLAESVEELLTEAGSAMDHILDWLDRLNSDRFLFGRQRRKTWKDSVEANEHALKGINDALSGFLGEKR
jgi:hypothetical protein